MIDNEKPSKIFRQNFVSKYGSPKEEAKDICVKLKLELYTLIQGLKMFENKVRCTDARAYTNIRKPARTNEQAGALYCSNSRASNLSRIVLPRPDFSIVCSISSSMIKPKSS